MFGSVPVTLYDNFCKKVPHDKANARYLTGPKIAKQNRAMRTNNAIPGPSGARNSTPGISRCHRHLESFEPDSVRRAHRTGPTGDDAKNKKGTLLRSLFIFGGATRNRTGDRGVADLCLTAWPWRRSFERRYYTTIPLFCQSFFQKSFKFIFDTVFLSPRLNSPRTKATVLSYASKLLTA